MPFHIEYDPEQDIITVTFTGAITMALVKEYLAALLPILEKTHCTRLLSDSRSCEVELSSLDIMQFPRMAEASPLTACLKRAVLVNPGTSGYELYATLSTNRGQQVKVFHNKAEAEAWLLAAD